MEGDFVLSDLSISFKRKQSSRESKLSNSDVILTLISSTTGIGFLVLPLSFALSGWGLSIIICAIITVIQVNANYALIRAASRLKVTNYPALVAKAVDSNVSIATMHALLFLMNFATVVSYVLTILNIFSSTMLSLTKSKIHFMRNIGIMFVDISPTVLVIAINALLTLFVVFKNKFLNFSWLAFCSVCAMLFAVICVSAVSFLKRDPSIIQTNMVFAKFQGLPFSLYIFVFAFMNSPSLIELYHERNKKNVRKFKRLLYIAFGLVLIIYITMSMSAYYGAGDLLIGYQKTNILLAPYGDFTVGQIANIFVVIFLFVHTALQFIPNKEMLMNWIGVSNRSSYVFHIFTVLVLVIAETLITLFVVKLKIQVKSLIMCIVIFFAPIVGYHFPFFVFLKSFNGIRAEINRSNFYTILLFLGIFLHVMICMSWILVLILF